MIVTHTNAMAGAHEAVLRAVAEMDMGHIEKAIAWAEISKAWSGIANQVQDRSGIARVQVVGPLSLGVGG